MNVLFVGCGAIGSILAAHFSHQAQVHVYDPWKLHTDKINREGIKVSGKAEFVSRGINASHVPDFISDQSFDMVVFAVKSIHTAEAVATIQPRLHGSPMLLTVQNGIGNETILASQLPGHVYQGATQLAATIKEAGHVSLEKIGKTWLGPLAGPAPAQTLGLEQLFHSSGLAIEVMDDPRGAVWSKLLFNAAINPLTAILQIPSKYLIDIPYAKDIMQTTLNEGKAIADALGIRLLYDPEEAVFAPRAAAHYSSMAQDIQQGRQTEIDFINGAIVKAAGKVGLRAPLNEWLTGLIKTLEWKNENHEILVRALVR